MTDVPSFGRYSLEAAHEQAWIRLLYRDRTVFERLLRRIFAEAAAGAPSGRGCIPIEFARDWVGDQPQIFVRETFPGVGSDLYLVCIRCRGLRVILELKGPQAPPNEDKRSGRSQLVKYAEAVRSGEARSCICMAPEWSPFLVVLDARNRTRAKLAHEYSDEALAGWIVIPYQQVLHDPVEDESGRVEFLLGLIPEPSKWP